MLLLAMSAFGQSVAEQVVDLIATVRLIPKALFEINVSVRRNERVGLVYIVESGRGHEFVHIVHEISM